MRIVQPSSYLTAIFDDNVNVAGLLSSHDASPVRLLIPDGLRIAAYPFAAPEAKLTESHTALIRLVLRKLHSHRFAEVATILTDLVQLTMVLTLMTGPPAPDPDD